MATPFKPKAASRSDADKQGSRYIPDVADAILDAHDLVTDATGTVYHYEQGPWLRLPEIHLEQIAMAYDRKGVSRNRRGEIIAFIKAQTFDKNLVWGRVENWQVPCLNGIIDLRTGKLEAHIPENYLERVIPWNHDPAAKCLVWDEAMETWFGSGESDGSIEALQEFFGYLLMAHARYKKALMLKGDPDCGKSQIVYAMQTLVGTSYTCQLSVEHMDDPTRRAVIKGKALNVMTELPTDALIADAGFKTLVSTEEPILLDEKYKQVEMYTPTAKHVIATNNLPRINDRTEATFRRILLLPMPNPIPLERQDAGLKEKLIAEMPGILLWSIAGAKRLYQNGGHWTEPESMKSAMADYKDELNPIRQFLLERCEVDTASAVPLVSLAKEYNTWNQGGKRITRNGVGKMLRRVGYKDKEQIKITRYGTKVLMSLIGYRLSTEHIPLNLDLNQG